MNKLIPIRFDRIIKTGGSTQPWIVFAIKADDELQEEIPYVVKLFSPDNVIQQPCIAKEFIVNFLAAEFELQVPHVGIIDLNEGDFVSTLNLETKQILANKHKGCTFASRLMEGTLVNDQLRNGFTSMVDFATIFAFDCLVLNIDRGGERNKPNLLIDEEGFILIDHELSLYFIDDEDGYAFSTVISNFEQNIVDYPYEKHLFYKRLKNYRGNKRTLFDSFEESLKCLNLSALANLLAEISAAGISAGATNHLIDYLRILKHNPGKFRNILLGIIS